MVSWAVALHRATQGGLSRKGGECSAASKATEGPSKCLPSDHGEQQQMGGRRGERGGAGGGGGGEDPLAQGLLGTLGVPL